MTHYLDGGPLEAQDHLKVMHQGPIMEFPFYMASMGMFLLRVEYCYELLSLSHAASTSYCDQVLASQ